MKKHIPNLISCLNLFSGSIAVVLAFEGLFFYAFLWIMLAAVMDFLDGMAARLLNAYSPIGKELDSLADIISFGFAPGIMIFKILQINSEIVNFGFPFLPYIAFLIPIFSALRLAKFNIDERQTDSFIGLPTPANAMFWASGIAGTWKYSDGNELLYTTIIIISILIFSWLMISEIPMFSLKMKKIEWKENQLKFILPVIGTIAIFFLGSAGIAFVILLYILISLCKKDKTK